MARSSPRRSQAIAVAAVRAGADCIPARLPLIYGIFVMTAANATEEARAEGRDLGIPYWRTLKADGSLNEKFPGGLEGHKALLEAEGFTVVQKGKQYCMPAYRDVLFCDLAEA